MSEQPAQKEQVKQTWTYIGMAIGACVLIAYYTCG